MAFKSSFIFPLIFLSVVYHHQTSARDLNLNEFQTKYQVAKFSESNSSFFSPLSPKITTNSLLTFAGWQTHKGAFHGASAKMSLWLIPNVKQNSVSQYSISVGDGFYYMTTGFHVYPALYRNNDLRFFTYWTADGGSSTGCYNTRCPGFVVANEATLHPGQAIAPPLSTYNGEDYWAILSIKKDEQTQDWSLYRTSQGKTTLLGWWPKTLFTSLTEAPKVQFNGMVSYILHNESPPMGSGHLASEGERKAAYFKQITLFDTNGNGFVPSQSDMVSTENGAHGCYTVSTLDETKDDGLMFYYGGPSGCNN